MARLNKKDVEYNEVAIAEFKNAMKKRKIWELTKYIL